MKKVFRIILKGFLGILLLGLIFLFWVFYPIMFPETPEQYEAKRVKLRQKIEKKTIDAYITEFDIKPKKKNSNFDPLIREFENQKDRFKFHACEFSYNDKSFFLRDTHEDLISVLGEPDKTRKTVTYHYPKGIIKCFDNSFEPEKLSFEIYDYPDSIDVGINLLNKDYTNFNKLLQLDQKELKKLQQKEVEKLRERYGDSLIQISDEITLTYEDFKITPQFNRDSNTGQYLLTNFYLDLTHYPSSSLDVIMFRGVPYKLSMNMYDFLDLSNLTRKDLNYHSIYIYDKDCSPSKNDVIYTSIDSDPYYEYMSIGHLGWRGPYNPDESLPIDYIKFSILTLEDLKYNEMANSDLLD